ncbi:response regulator transcription factor [Herbiconiux moechotypicola]|uniref:Response regulator transcription factor n=1 Tax=Herbiconiux moechotypicola TaxID=637393 RepID=A0ABN3DSL3_9MICO|nr:response regulator transcription factor [Herbiconiux moechotypicola]MCS5730607.1 response regulator transcription factor [Herbiconiux moechotypicola]
MRVLIVDDDAVLGEAVARGLQRASIAADVVLDGESALEHLMVHDYDAVVLDRALPGLHGDEVLEWIVGSTPRVKVLMLTATASLDDRVNGLAAGADDYLAKPFAVVELVARLRAITRRPSASIPPLLRKGGIALDPHRHEASRDGRVLALGRKEFAVLELLLEADGAVVSTEQLLEKAWDVNTDPFTNTVRVTLSSLRRKLGAPAAVETVIGVGYRIRG